MGSIDDYLPLIATLGIMCGMLGLLAWMFTTWLRVKNGYPLDGAWGQALYPKGADAVERMKLLTQENAQLRAELGSVKDRLANVERIVTDAGTGVAAEIERLRDAPVARQLS